MIEISLPWPHKYLNPNKKVNRYALNRVSQEAKDYAYKMTRSIHRIDHDPVANTYRSQYTFYPPDRRRRDTDNFVAACKHYQDGVAKALGVDDSCFEMDKPEWGDVVRGGKVTLRLAPMGETGLEELDDEDKRSKSWRQSRSA